MKTPPPLPWQFQQQSTKINKNSKTWIRLVKKKWDIIGIVIQNSVDDNSLIGEQKWRWKSSLGFRAGLFCVKCHIHVHTSRRFLSYTYLGQK